MRRISILSGLFLVLLFPAYSSMAADSVPGIILNEIQVEGTSASDEFIELRNISDSVASLSGWKLQKRTSSGSVSSIKSFGDVCLSLSPGDYLLWANSAGVFAPLADFVTTQSLAKTNAIELVDESGTVRDSLTWGDDALKGKSRTRDTETFSWETSDSPSPQGGGAFCPAPEEENRHRIQRRKRRNRPYRKPPSSASTSCSRTRWRRVRKTNGSNSIIRAMRTRTSPCSRSATRRLRGNMSFHPGRSSRVKDISSSSDPTADCRSIIPTRRFRFPIRTEPSSTRCVTRRPRKRRRSPSTGRPSGGARSSPPGKANRFGEEPSTDKTSIPKEGYKGVDLEFSAKGSDGQSYSWDFGDGKTSRKQSTSHTYKKTGKYHGTLTITDEDGIGENVKEFTVDIEDFPKVRLSITAIAPNPKGADTGVEWISVKNGGKKKINLIGFGIATGSNKKKLTNHPVTDSLVVKAGKERQLTSADASFTLPNEGGYVEIRRPDGKMVVGKSYKKSGGVDDDEVWRKIAGRILGVGEGAVEESEGGNRTETAPEKESAEESTTGTESAPVAELVIEKRKEVTLEDLSPEQLALLEARVEERLRGQILAELEASGKLAAAPETDANTDSGTVLGTSNEKSPASLFQELNALLGKMLFGN
jgi:PKD repeat protein